MLFWGECQIRTSVFSSINLDSYFLWLSWLELKIDLYICKWFSFKITRLFKSCFFYFLLSMIICPSIYLCEYVCIYTIYMCVYIPFICIPKKPRYTLLTQWKLFCTKYKISFTISCVCVCIYIYIYIYIVFEAPVV